MVLFSFIRFNLIFDLLSELYSFGDVPAQNLGSIDTNQLLDYRCSKYYKHFSN